MGSISLTSEVDGQEGVAAIAASPLDMKERLAVDVTIVSQPFGQQSEAVFLACKGAHRT